jgi:hypothetical protein
MGDAIDRNFPKNSGLARRILRKLRAKRVTKSNPKTIDKVEDWFKKTEQSDVCRILKDFVRIPSIPVDSNGNWKSGNSPNDGVYLTNATKAKNLGQDQNDFRRL